MNEKRSTANQPAALPGPLGVYILERLAGLEARADRLARQAEEAGDVKTALAATRVSLSILTKLAGLAEKCPEAAALWQPQAVVSQPGAMAPPAPKHPAVVIDPKHLTQELEKIAPSTDPEPGTRNSELSLPPATPAPVRGPLRPVNADWHRWAKSGPQEG